MHRKTTCTCLACQNIPTLDLKFIAHHGDYIVQNVAGIRELVGSDVNLIHRLLKNHLAESTGWRAYMMLTEGCLGHLNLNLKDTHVQTEEYEHLGPVKTYSLNLHERYQEMIDERRILIDEKDADAIFRIDFSTPPAVTWEWLQEPLKRNLWAEDMHWSLGDRPKGRAGKGAQNHCAHGKTFITAITLDWRPFEYSTTDSFENGKKVFSETLRLEPLSNGGTRLHDVMQMHLPIPHFLRRLVVPLILKYSMNYEGYLHKAAQLAHAEYLKRQEEA